MIQYRNDGCDGRVMMDLSCRGLVWRKIMNCNVFSSFVILRRVDFFRRWTSQSFKNNIQN
jgi:hypothetical protein